MEAYHIALFAATRWERRAAQAALDRLGPTASTGRRTTLARGAFRWTLVQCGIGPEKATRAVRELLGHERCDLVMSVGFACALVPSAPGDLLIGTAVRPLSDPAARQPAETPCESGLQAGAIRAAKAVAVPVRTGPIVSTDRVLVLATEKQEAARAARAIGADMESAALGAVAAEHRTPFLVTRTVSDLMDEDLPVDFNLFLSPSGWLRGVLGLLRPASLVGMRRLHRQTALASERLTVFLSRFLDELTAMAARPQPAHHG